MSLPLPWSRDFWRRLRRTSPRTLARVPSKLRDLLEPLLGRALLPGGPSSPAATGPVLLHWESEWRSELVEKLLESLSRADLGGKQLVFYVGPAQAGTVRRWLDGRNLPWKVAIRTGEGRGAIIDPAKITEELARSGEAHVPSWAGVLRAPLKFHPAWLRQLEELARGGPNRGGYWCPWYSIARFSPAFVAVPRQVTARPDGMLFERGSNGAWPMAFVPISSRKSGRGGLVLQLLVALGLIRPKIVVSALSFADNLAFYDARAKKEPADGLSPTEDLAADGWDCPSLAQVIPYNYFRYLRGKAYPDDHLDGIANPCKIDLVLLAVPKDIEILPWTLLGARKCIDHEICRTIVIGPVDGRLMEFCRREGCEFVDETEVSPLPRRQIRHTVRGVDRSGWIFQQLLKYNSSTRVTQAHYMIIDADTVLLRRQRFGEEGRYRLRCADDYHLPYFRVYEKLTGFRPTTEVSFIAHHMLFCVQVLRRLQARMQEVSGLPWYQAILNNLDPGEMSSVSDYETYGCWLLDQEPAMQVSVQHWRNAALPRVADSEMAELLRWAARQHDSVSFHHYFNAK